MTNASDERNKIKNKFLFRSSEALVIFFARAKNLISRFTRFARGNARKFKNFIKF